MNAAPGRPVVSRLSEGRANVLSRPPLSYSSFLLLVLLRFLPSRLCEIRSRRRSAALKLRAGNGSRRPGAKRVRALFDRDSGGAVALFLSHPRFIGHCSSCKSDEEEFTIDFSHGQKLLNKKRRAILQQRYILYFLNIP